MSMRVTRERLRQEVDSLPENLAEEVFDFVLFVKARRTEEAYLWSQVEETRAYRLKHPADVRTVTIAEWEAEIADLENQS